ncbi:hypothetical protein [Actinacidiphila sp. ITFR-21]|uniref:hypothetical protein n=1 Tax=Actinacidiphila sp. ITFR-21 TaxID=3075199 RepID=UPI00288AD58D|nr:hypothetical protein [Streptomyces sp. ITFR-21]WNI19159.1 hypothetical protein RLT57_28890 [Streptomyces sp. ITFR-21]
MTELATSTPESDVQAAPAPVPDAAPPCSNCGHPHADHSRTAEQRARYNLPNRPWCHDCDGTCDYQPAASVEAKRHGATPEQAVTYEDIVFTRRVGHPLSVDTAPRHSKMSLALLFDARAYIHAHDPGHLVFADQVEYAVTGYDPADCTLTLELAKDHRPDQNESEPTADLDITPYLVIHRYRTDRGDWSWSWRCWGDGDCDGWLALDLSDRTYAERKAREHLADEHASPTP